MEQALKAEEIAFGQTLDAGMARLSRSPASRQLAIATGALALGGGVWAMHFIGMLAMSLPVKVSYDPLLSGLSAAKVGRSTPRKL